MKYKKTKEYFEVELTMSEAEIESLIGTIEELQMIKNRAMEDIQGIRGEIYKHLCDIRALKVVR